MNAFKKSLSLLSLLVFSNSAISDANIIDSLQISRISLSAKYGGIVCGVFKNSTNKYNLCTPKSDSTFPDNLMLIRSYNLSGDAVRAHFDTSKSYILDGGETAYHIIRLSPCQENRCF